MHFPFVEKRQIAQFKKVVGIFPEGKSHTTSKPEPNHMSVPQPAAPTAMTLQTEAEFPVLTLNNTWVKSASTIWFNKAVSLLCIL